VITRGLLLRMANSPAIERFVKRNGMSAGFARRFIAGETLEETIAPIRVLNQRGITATLDYLGENVKRPEEAEQSVAYYLRLLQFIEDNRLKANVSLKLTQLGLDLGQEVACANVRRILDAAARTDQFVRIDMEGSAYTEATLDLFYCLWSHHKNVGVVIQSYLYRSAADVEKLIEAGARVRLVKGAYDEPREVAYPDKADVDANYLRLMRSLLMRGNYPAIATHDEAILRAAKEVARVERIGPERFEFQMLFGIRRDLQDALVKEGYGMRVYVPFGTQWYPYMMRRLAERPANLGFVLRNLIRR
jgi:proline dehydrogenase